MSGQAFEIPHLELARHFAHRGPHEVDFSRGDPLPLCRYCDRPMDGVTWAREEPCPANRQPTPTQLDRINRELLRMYWQIVGALTP